jgi:hypothetical protein
MVADAAPFGRSADTAAASASAWPGAGAGAQRDCRQWWGQHFTRAGDCPYGSHFFNERVDSTIEFIDQQMDAFLAIADLFELEAFCGVHSQPCHKCIRPAELIIPVPTLISSMARLSPRLAEEA